MRLVNEYDKFVVAIRIVIVRGMGRRGRRERRHKFLLIQCGHSL